MATIFGMGGQAYRTVRRRCIAGMLLTMMLASIGCAGRRFDALMRSWEGQTLADLFRTWGQPDFFYTDGQGGRVAVSVPTSSARPSRRSAEAERVRSASSVQVYQADMKNSWPTFRIFFVDAGGRIARSEWRGRWECCNN